MDLLFDLLFKAISSDPKLKVAVCVLLGFSILSLLFFLKKWIPLWRELSRTNKKLNDLLISIKIIDHSTYDSLYSEMKNSKTFSHYWNEFDETVIKDAASEDVKIYNTKPFSSFISLESLLESKLSISLFRKIPSLITSIGLFFTFLFIVYGLSELHIQEGKQVVQGIDHLINGLSAKFWSSVIAIFISIAFTLIEDRLVHIISNNYHAMMNLLDKKFENKTAEDYLASLDKNIAQLNNTMKLFGTDLAGVIKDGLTDGMKPSTDRLLQAISTLEKQKSENIADTLSNVLQEFKSTLNQSTGSEFAELGTQITRLAQIMNDSSEKTSLASMRMDNLVKSLDENLIKQENTSAHSITKVQESFEQILKGVSDSSRQQAENFKTLMDEMLKNTNSATNGVIANVESITNRNTDLANNFDNLNLTLGKNLESYTKSAGITQELIKSTGAVVAQVNTSLSQLNELQAKIDGTYKQFLDQASIIQQIQKENMQSVDRFSAVFKEVESGLEGVLKQIGDNIGKYNDLTKQGLQTYLDQYDNSLASATTKLSSTVRDMDDVLENLSDSLETIKSATKSEIN